MATSIARPALASQAEKASINMGIVVEVVELSVRDHRESITNRASIMASRQRRADKRWVRWKARPIILSKKAVETVKCVGVIWRLWILTTNF